MVPRSDNYGQRIAALGKQLSDPDSIDGIPEPCPTKGGAQLVSRRYRRVVEYTPAADAFSVVMTPDIEAPGFITGKSVRIIPAVPGPLQGKPHHKSSETARGGAYHATEYDQQLVGIFKDNVGHVLAKTNTITDGSGVSMEGFAIVHTNGRTMSVTNESDKTATISIHLLDTGSGNWAFWVKATLASHATESWTVAAGASNAVALTNSLPDSRVLVSMAFPSAQMTVGTINHFAPAFDKQALQLGVSSGRVLSMSMKITNTSEKLKRKGAACGGRVPHTFHAWDNISAELSRRPRNRRYHGTADKGLRVGWLPEQVDEWAFDNLHKKIETYRESQYLIGHLSGLDADTSFLLTFTWLVDFTLESQNFPLTTSPAWGDEFEQLVHLLAVADAATCNPLSADVFKNLLRSVQPYIESGEAHYRRHKPLYDYLLRQAARMI
jgi:hypothetical protein